MGTRAATLALVSLTSAALAAVGFALAAWLDVFAPCRVVYRAPQVVYDSLACQSYAAIALFSSLLVGAAGVLGIVATVLLYGRRRAADRRHALSSAKQ